MIDITNQEAERVGESIGHWIVDLVITLLEIIWDIITTYLAWTFYIAIVLFILGAVLKYFGFFTNQETGEISHSGQSVYYLHPDGSIDQNNTDRITPVFWKLKDLDDSDTWDQEALEAAVEELTPQQYDNEIILLYAAEDNLVYPATIPIGTKAKIYLEGNVYKSILTGRILKSGTIELTFGQVRSMLTKKLIMERRR